MSAETNKYFFALNHYNCARWLVKYYHSILKLNEIHPEIYNKFKQGWFATIDSTLEQTIDAEAASQSLGIFSITNSISARQRWAESHCLHTNIASTLLEQLGMIKKDDVSQHINPNKIKKANASVTQVLVVLREMANPFKMARKGLLLNIATGKSITSETENFLLNINILQTEKETSS